jgi:hypothetical protein
VFSQPKIRETLKKYVTVALYCDRIPPECDTKKSPSDNRALRDTTFKSTQLPLYAIVKPTGGGKFEVVKVYGEGKINYPDRFQRFLERPLKKS